MSTAGGLVEAQARGQEIGCRAIQVFSQSPRMWRPTSWKEHDIADFRRLMQSGPIRSVTIHAVYLINCASSDREIRSKSLASLTHALRMGEAIGADGVVVHPGSAVGGRKAPAMRRAGKAFAGVLAESERCPLLLEDTAGGGTTLGRSFDELAEMISVAGGGERLGICLDSCHLLASGYDVRDRDGLTAALDECDDKIGLDRLRCLHVNDSKTALGSNSDRHAPIGTGELGTRGCSAFLSEPRFEGLPALFEGPGASGKAIGRKDIDRMKQLRQNGLRARKGRAG